MKTKALSVFFALLSIGYTNTSLAESLQDHQAIRQSVQAFIDKQLTHSGKKSIRVGVLDKHLRLTPCQAPLAVFLPPGANLPKTNTVGVRCHGPKSWTVYVPVKIKLFTNVVVAARPLLRGTLISANHLRHEEREQHHLGRGYYTDIGAITGHNAKRIISQGRIISPMDIAPPILIRRGQKVMIIAEVGTLRVRMQGVALSNGARGERIQVRNHSSRRIIEGLVSGPQQITVNM